MSLPITDDDVPGIRHADEPRLSGARGRGGADDRSTQESYLSGDRITKHVLRAGESDSDAIPRLIEPSPTDDQ